MDFKHPVVVYTAHDNIEVYALVELLRNNGISAKAVEDQSGVSLWMLGTIGQFHRPKIYVDQPDEVAARELLANAEAQRRAARQSEASGGEEVTATCEECGQISLHPAAHNGTTQTCPHCGAYLDVGELPWEEDFGKPEE